MDAAMTGMAMPPQMRIRKGIVPPFEVLAASLEVARQWLHGGPFVAPSRRVIPRFALSVGPEPL